MVDKSSIFVPEDNLNMISEGNDIENFNPRQIESSSDREVESLVRPKEFSDFSGQEKDFLPVQIIRTGNGSGRIRCLPSVSKLRISSPDQMDQSPYLIPRTSFICSIGISCPVHILKPAAPWKSIMPKPFMFLQPTSLAMRRNSVSAGA